MRQEQSAQVLRLDEERGRMSPSLWAPKSLSLPLLGASGNWQGLSGIILEGSSPDPGSTATRLASGVLVLAARGRNPVQLTVPVKGVLGPIKAVLLTLTNYAPLLV